MLALASVAGVTALDIYCAPDADRESPMPLPPMRDYSDRSGLPRPPKAMRGAARDFEAPRDFRTPEALGRGRARARATARDATTSLSKPLRRSIPRSRRLAPGRRRRSGF